jgi:hypothetical protein
LLAAHNDGWRTPAGTFPAPQWTIELAGEARTLLVLWLGPNWLGGREGSGSARDNRLRDLSTTARLALLDILGVAEPPSYALLWGRASRVERAARAHGPAHRASMS